MWVTTEKKKNPIELLICISHRQCKVNTPSYESTLPPQTCFSSSSLSTNPESTILSISGDQESFWSQWFYSCCLPTSYYIIQAFRSISLKESSCFFPLYGCIHMPMCSLQLTLTITLSVLSLQNCLELLLVSYILSILGLCSQFSLAFRIQLKYYHL